MLGGEGREEGGKREGRGREEGGKREGRGREEGREAEGRRGREDEGESKEGEDKNLLKYRKLQTG